MILSLPKFQDRVSSPSVDSATSIRYLYDGPRYKWVNGPENHRSNRIGPDDWSDFKPAICYLYQDRDLTLHKVMAYMVKYHGFSPR